MQPCRHYLTEVDTGSSSGIIKGGCGCKQRVPVCRTDAALHGNPYHAHSPFVSLVLPFCHSICWCSAALPPSCRSSVLDARHSVILEKLSSTIGGVKQGGDEQRPFVSYCNTEQILRKRTDLGKTPLMPSWLAVKMDLNRCTNFYKGCSAESTARWNLQQDNPRQ